MKWVSTRGKAPAVSLATALQEGLAPDGGLYVPERFPAVDLAGFSKLRSLSEIAAAAVSGFFEGETLEKELSRVCEEAFSFPAPLKTLKRNTAVLELFRGPSAAFKDFGARFLASWLERIDAQTRTILVATSGDTGGAVAAAFHGRPKARVMILFPKGRISARQERQLTCWGDNVRSLAITGSFDDCQRMVKTALADPDLRTRLRLGSANSVNVGRLLPQLAYFAAASLWYSRDTGSVPAFIVPSGNVGNSLGGLWARKLGFPIRSLTMATNANRPVPDYLKTGVWKPRPSVATLANAMDVGDPSNMERVFSLYPGVEDLRKDVNAVSISDETIRETIRAGEKNWGEIWCPHTATAVAVREKEPSPDWIIVATAHPAKFETIVEPLVGHPIEVPESLRELLARPSQVTEIGPDYAEFRADLEGWAKAQ